MFRVLSLLPLKNLYFIIPVKFLIPIAFLQAFVIQTINNKKIIYSKPVLLFFIHFVILGLCINGLVEKDTLAITLSIGSFCLIYNVLLSFKDKLKNRILNIIILYGIFHFFFVIWQVNMLPNVVFEKESLVINEKFIRISGAGYVNDNSFISGLLLILALQTKKPSVFFLSLCLMVTNVTGAVYVSLMFVLLLVKISNLRFVKIGPCLFLIFIGFLVVGFIAAQKTGLSFVDERILSLSIRVVFWVHALTEYVDVVSIKTFLFGCGGACSRALIDELQYGTTHSTYIGIIIDYGIIGLLIWVKLIIWLSNKNSAVCVYALVFAITHEYYYVMSNLLYVWFVSIIPTYKRGSSLSAIREKYVKI